MSPQTKVILFPTVVVLRIKPGTMEEPNQHREDPHIFSLRLIAEHFTPTDSNKSCHRPAHVKCSILTPHGWEPAWNADPAGISEPVTPEKSISGRKCRGLGVTFCRLNAVLSPGRHRDGPGGALSSHRAASLGAVHGGREVNEWTRFLTRGKEPPRGTVVLGEARHSCRQLGMSQAG